MSSQVGPLSLKCYEYNFSLLRKVRNVYLNIHECIVTKLTFVFISGWKDILRPILAIQLTSTTLSLSDLVSNHNTLDRDIWAGHPQLIFKALQIAWWVIPLNTLQPLCLMGFKKGFA